MITPYRDNPRPALQPPPRVSWWRRFFLGWLDARRARQRAETEHKRHLAALRWASDRAWGHWYARSHWCNEESFKARREYLKLEAAVAAEAGATP